MAHLYYRTSEFFDLHDLRYMQITDIRDLVTEHEEMMEGFSIVLSSFQQEAIEALEVHPPTDELQARVQNLRATIRLKQ